MRKVELHKITAKVLDAPDDASRLQSGQRPMTPSLDCITADRQYRVYDLMMLWYFEGGSEIVYTDII